MRSFVAAIGFDVISWEVCDEDVYVGGSEMKRETFRPLQFVLKWKGGTRIDLRGITEKIESIMEGGVAVGEDEGGGREEITIDEID